MTADTQEPDDADVILRRADTVQLFLNPKGDLVFRRETHPGEGEEQYVHVVIPRDHRQSRLQADAGTTQGVQGGVRQLARVCKAA